MKPFTHNRKQKGAFLVLFAVLLPVFLLLVALVSEIGRIWAYHTKLQNAADAAALAGAANFVNGDTIDSHPNADLFADRYVTVNLGHNLTTSPNLQQFQAKTKAATGSEEEKSYYRVHLEEEIPLIQATAAWLHRPTFLVKATAVALIGKEGTSGGGGIKLGNLVNVGFGRGGFDGSFYNNNQGDKIGGATFEGDVVVWDWRNYYKENNQGRYMLYTREAYGKSRETAISQGMYKYPSAGVAPNGSNPEKYYNEQVSASEQAVKDAFKDIPKTENDQNYTITISDNGQSMYRLASNVQNMNINLSDNSLNSNDPVYLYVDDDLSLLHISLQSNIRRPVIICYFGHQEINNWNKNPITNVQFDANTYDFRGSLYVPGSSLSPFNFDKQEKDQHGNVLPKQQFHGSIYANEIEFNATHGDFTFEEFSLPGGGGGSGTPAVKPRLVDNSLW